MFTQEKGIFSSAPPTPEKKGCPLEFLILRSLLEKRLAREITLLKQQEKRVPRGLGISCEQLSQEMAKIDRFKKKKGFETIETEDGRWSITRNHSCFTENERHPSYKGLYCGHPDSVPKGHYPIGLCGDHIQTTEEQIEGKRIFTVEILDAAGHGSAPSSLALLARRYLDYVQKYYPNDPVKQMEELNEYITSLPLDDHNASEVSFLYTQITQKENSPTKTLSFARAGSGSVFIISKNENRFFLTHYGSEPTGPKNSPVAEQPTLPEDIGHSIHLGALPVLLPFKPFKKELASEDAVIALSDGIFDTTVTTPENNPIALGLILHTVFEEVCQEALKNNPSITQQEIGTLFVEKLIKYHLEDGEPQDDVTILLAP